MHAKAIQLNNQTFTFILQLSIKSKLEGSAA